MCWSVIETTVNKCAGLFFCCIFVHCTPAVREHCHPLHNLERTSCWSAMMSSLTPSEPLPLPLHHCHCHYCHYQINTMKKLNDPGYKENENEQAEEEEDERQFHI